LPELPPFNNALQHKIYTNPRFEMFITNVSYKPFMVVMFQVDVFWGCDAIVVGYQHFRGPCCLQFQGGDGGSVDLQNVGIPPQHYTASQLRRHCFVLFKILHKQSMVCKIMLIIITADIHSVC
jgi:hypothetical protein